MCGIEDASVRGSCLRRCRVTVHSSAVQWSRQALVAVNVVLHQYSGKVEFHNNNQQAQIFLCKRPGPLVFDLLSIACQCYCQWKEGQMGINTE